MRICYASKTMRVSPQRHTLAVLRILVGLTQKEMAAVLHCSTPTIQAIELGRLKLSEKLAGLASLNTGINLTWLLDNDVTHPPIDTKGKPYTKATFEGFQANNDIRKDPPMENEIAGHCRDQISFRLHALLLRAYINGDTDLCVYKLSKAFDELEKQFRVTDADRRAIKPVKRTPKFEAEMKKDGRLVWWEYYTRIYDVLDQEEKKKIAKRGLKPMTEAECKQRNIKAVYLDDAGQMVVKRFDEAKPTNVSAKSKKK
jgi:DNA-binding XRE family transcriptional regulator